MPAQRPGLADLSDDDRQELESWLAEFDQNWGDGVLSGRVSQIPPGSSWRLPALAEMVKIDLERQWQAGHRISLESYLLDFPELGRREDVSVDLIQAEYDVRRQFGAPADVEEYARRFPHQAAELRRAVGPGGASAAQLPSTVSVRRPAVPPQEIPERFGRYRIIKRLGRGGMGSVFLAEDTQLGRRVALKVSHFEAADAHEARERFSREARAAATLDHPYLCPVYDVGVIDGVHFLTMAYIEGKTLAASVRDAGLPQRQVAAVIGKIAVALQEAHARGVVHRDLKPSNIMIKETGQRREPVIVDFGLARQENAQELRVTKTGQALGTPAYMAPEQVRGNLKEIGPACDVYALGVILYELLTGRLPFNGSGLAVVGQILTQEPLPPSTHRPDLDPRLEAICLKAMAKTPSARYPSMSDLAAALTDYLKNPTPSAVSSPSGAAAPRPGGVEPRAAGSDTLVGQFFDRLAIESASVPIQIRGANPVARPAPSDGRRGPRRSVLIAASAIVVVLGVILFVVTDKGRIKIVVADPDAVVKVDGDEVNIKVLGEPISLRAGTHNLDIRWGTGKFQTRKFVVGRGPNKDLIVEYTPGVRRPPTANPAAGAGFETRVGGGVWTLEGDELVQSLEKPRPGEATLYTLAFGERSWSDYDLTLEAKSSQGDLSFGALFHWLDDAHNVGFILGAYGNNGNELRTMYMGQWGRKPEHYRQQKTEPDRWYRIKLIVRGRSVRCDLDGVPYFEGVDGRVTHGLVALCSIQTVARFRRIRVTAPDGKVLFEGLPALPAAVADVGGAPAAPRPAIPADAKEFSGRYFKVFQEELGWHQARARCEEMGGHLAVVRGEDENNFLTSLVSSAAIDAAWLGATDENQEGRWLWVDGSEVRYENWDAPAAQPNNKAGSGLAEHYLLTLVTRKGGWWDLPDRAERQVHPGFICQWRDDAAAGPSKPRKRVVTNRNDAKPFGGKKFKAFTEELSWHGAAIRCEEMGGRLAVVKGEAENTFLTSLIADAGLGTAWLGATDEQKEGRWVWVDGTDMLYNAWDTNQPSNLSTWGSVEHYLQAVVSRKGAWNDVPNQGERQSHPGFVCQWD